MHGTKPPRLWRDFVHQFGNSPYIHVAGYFCNKTVPKVELVDQIGDYSGLLPRESCRHQARAQGQNLLFPSRTHVRHSLIAAQGNEPVRAQQDFTVQESIDGFAPAERDVAN